mgnify:CR=1 FL=1
MNNIYISIFYICFIKFLITGGAGFLGSHLIEHHEGEISVVDNFSTVKYELPKK